jgi:uncharacterized protein (TIGR02996 family)
MWVPFDVHGEVKGRIRGVSLPYPNGEVMILTDQGLFLLWYSRSAFVSKLAKAADAEELFDPAAGVLTWEGKPYPMLGGCAPANDPRRFTLHPSGDRVALDAEEEAAQVLDAAGGVRQTIHNVHVSSEPWAVAAFSADGKALVVADPTGVRLFRYEATTGTERPRWAAVGGAGEQKQLLRAILDNPDDDTPRLIYADWLDEHGDPGRAEFVRVQCRLAERKRGASVPGDDPEQRREFELEEQLGARWLAEMPAVRGLRWVGFWRGFPCVVVTSATTLVRAAEKVWAAAPVEYATITGLNLGGARALAGSEALGRLRALALDGYSTAREGEKPLRTLFHSPRVRTLRRLTLPYGVGEAGVIVVAASPHLTGLEWLTVGAPAMTDDAADAVIASPALANLRGGSLASYHLSGRARARLKKRFPNVAV